MKGGRSNAGTAVCYLVFSQGGGVYLVYRDCFSIRLSGVNLSKSRALSIE